MNQKVPRRVGLGLVYPEAVCRVTEILYKPIRNVHYSGTPLVKMLCSFERPKQAALIALSDVTSGHSRPIAEELQPCNPDQLTSAAKECLFVVVNKNLPRVVDVVCGEVLVVTIWIGD